MAVLDFTTLTEVDINSNLSVAQTVVSWTDMDNADTAYTYYDFGAGHITGEWTVTWDFEISGLDNSGEWVLWMAIGNMPGLPGSAEIDQGFNLYAYKYFNNLWVRCDKVGTHATGNTYELISTPASGHLWGTLTHNADNSYNLYYHDDAERTSQVHTANFTIDSQAFQHMGFGRSMDTGTDLTTGYIQNVDVVGFSVTSPTYYQDHFAFHHPVPVQTGDRFGNVRYTNGGNLWYNVIDDFTGSSSWDSIEHQLDVDMSWDIINDKAQSISWDILNDKTQNFSWDILNGLLQQTSWHIHPAIIEYIQQAKSKSLQFHFLVRRIQTGFEVTPIIKNFNVTGEITTSHKVRPIVLDTFEINQIQTSFELREAIQTNFTVIATNNNTRRVYP